MSYLYRVHLTVEVRAMTMGDAEYVVHGILNPRHELGNIEYVDTEEVDETPTDAQMSSFYSQCEAGQPWL